MSISCIYEDYGFLRSFTVYTSKGTNKSTVKTSPQLFQETQQTQIKFYED
jgi:hypothetical protein